MPPAVAAATIQLWQSGTLSKRTHQKLAKGAPTNPDRDFDAEGEIDQDGPTRGTTLTTARRPTVQVKIKGKTTMRVMIAASIVAFGVTTTARAGLRYYIDQDVLRKNDAPTLLHRAMRDIGSNPTGWSHRW